jgi:hypothetical protein
MIEIKTAQDINSEDKSKDNEEAIRKAELTRHESTNLDLY